MAVETPRHGLPVALLSSVDVMTRSNLDEGLKLAWEPDWTSWTSSIGEFEVENRLWLLSGPWNPGHIWAEACSFVSTKQSSQSQRLHAVTHLLKFQDFSSTREGTWFQKWWKDMKDRSVVLQKAKSWGSYSSNDIPFFKMRHFICKMEPLVLKQSLLLQVRSARTV